jgi:putative membrane protein
MRAMRFLARLVLNGIAIVVAAYVVPGMELTGLGSALAAGVILGFVNAIVRPILFLLTLPLTLLTLGLFILVLNAICLGLTAAVIPGFSIDGVLPAILGALLVSIVSWILNGLFTDASESRA